MIRRISNLNNDWVTRPDEPIRVPTYPSNGLVGTSPLIPFVDG